MLYYCILSFLSEDMVNSSKKLPCGHIFHTSCLRSWFQRQQTCPTCRLNILRSPASRTATGAAGGAGAAGGPAGVAGNNNNNNIEAAAADAANAAGVAANGANPILLPQRIYNEIHLLFDCI